MTTRRNFFTVLVGLASAVPAEAPLPSRLSWFKRLEPKREIVVNLPRGNWEVLAELLRKQLVDQGLPVTERELSKRVLWKIERILAAVNIDGPGPVSVAVIA
jgi:hypothetical protein